MKRIVTMLICAIMLLCSFPVCAVAQEDIAPFEVKSKSAVLMDAESGQVLYAKNADEALPPASVTKVMTLLCIFEAIDSGALALTDKVTVSENAASMGGSQVYLEVGEEMTVDEMLKCVVVSSANDAAVALAEKISGSEEAFVMLMNQRAADLGMENTNFENVTGLDDATVNHTISALDIATVSRELITKHPGIFNYTTIWMDTVRNGEFGLSNTNRLIRFYDGATGLKTGSTSKAGFCISATAERGGMHLIAVIMGSETRDVRNAAATTLLDWGFATYSVYTAEGGSAGEIKVTGGENKTVPLEYAEFKLLMGKGKENKITAQTELPESVAAPVKKGDTVGYIKYLCDGEEIGKVPITASDDSDRLGFFGLLLEFFRRYCAV